MNKYFKKFSIMFVMALAIIGFGAIKDCNIANAATVGQQLSSAESGWQRIPANTSTLDYEGSWKISDVSAYNIDPSDTNIKLKLRFKGTKFRLIGRKHPSYCADAYIKVDGISHSLNFYNNVDSSQILMFESLGLSDGFHDIEIGKNAANYIEIYSFDIDEAGYLMTSNSQVNSITIDDTSLNLPVDSSQELTATTTPAGAQIEWSSDNTGIATVEQDGTIKGIAVGTATITAKIKGTDIKATCVVTVTPKGTNTDPTNPNHPPQPAGDGNLFIELVDGQIKSYQVTASQIEDFKQWYLDRDNTKSNKPYYHFTKGSYNDYVIHDKIDWFEVR